MYRCGVCRKTLEKRCQSYRLGGSVSSDIFFTDFCILFCVTLIVAMSQYKWYQNFVRSCISDDFFFFFLHVFHHCNVQFILTKMFLFSQNVMFHCNIWGDIDNQYLLMCTSPYTFDQTNYITSMLQLITPTVLCYFTVT